MNYNTALETSPWALKVTEVHELMFDPPRTTRAFDIVTTYLKGDFRVVIDRFGHQSRCLLFVDRTFVTKIGLDYAPPFRQPSDEVSFLSRDQDALDMLTDESGCLLNATIFPDPDTDCGAFRPIEHTSEIVFPTEEMNRKLRESLLSLISRVESGPQRDLS